MKKIILLLAVLLMFSGCKKQQENIPETQPKTLATETTIPETKPLPDTVIAYADVKEVPILLTTFSRGDTVQIVEIFDSSRTLIRHNGVYALMDTDLLQLPRQSEYSEWTGYLSWNGNLFDNYHLQGTPMERTTQGVQVIDELANCYVIQWNDTIGYALKTNLSRWPAASYDGGDSGGSSGAADGGEISLTSLFRQSGTVTGTGTVKANGAEAYIGSYLRGEQIDVVKEESLLPPLENYTVVYDNGLLGYVKTEFLRMDAESSFTEWTGYAGYNTVIYNSFHLYGEVLKKPSFNAEITVLKELEYCYFVRTDDVMGYAAKESVSKEKNPVYTGDSDSGSTGGGDDWSPPML